MPHIVVTMVTGKSAEQKAELTRRIVSDVMDVLEDGEDAVSLAIEEVSPEDWAAKVYEPEIKGKWASLYKEPGYRL